MSYSLKGCKIKNEFAIHELITISKQSFSGGYFFGGESHDFFEIVCVLEGTVGITAGKNIFLLSKGQMTIHAPLEFHAIWEYNESAPTCLIISFAASVFLKLRSHIYDLTEELLEDIKKIYESSKRVFDILPHADNILDGATAKFEHGLVVCGIQDGQQIGASKFVKALELFLLSAFETPSDTETFDYNNTGENYTKILAVMEEYIDEKLNMNELSRLCGMSIPLIEKTVHKYLHCGAMSYYNSIRMNKAHQMISGGNSVKNTAFALGYSDQNYFSMSFKKHFGYAPSKIKR